ncbi:stage III sporulation protein AB [Acutalibacter caecimuris]|uniref:stage III sporulation protein AB n=1 Tax=Acutalibacter caecimuris TaxID=3093657 RepID=UPI002AC9C44B|nr:stage III sporulation protein AB [Acutalibacter sp. M00118]
MKLVGAIFLILSGVIWGIEQAGSLKRRVERLTDLFCLVRQMLTEITYSSRPLSEMIAAGDSLFCRKAIERESFADDPASALAWAGDQILTCQKDKDLLSGFTQNLGTSDTQGQQEHLQLYLALIGDRLQEARDAYGQKRRLYLALGLFAGLTVCIVIL